MEAAKRFDRAAAERATGKGPLKAVDVIRRAFSRKAQPYTTPWLQENGEPLVVYFTPITLQDSELAAALESDPKASWADKELAMLVHKAQDAEGNLLFSPVDAIAIKNSARIRDIKDMLAFMYRVGSITHEEAKEEIKNDPSSAGS